MPSNGSKHVVLWVVTVAIPTLGQRLVAWPVNLTRHDVMTREVDLFVVRARRPKRSPFTRKTHTFASRKKYHPPTSVASIFDE